MLNLSESPGARWNLSSTELLIRFACAGERANRLPLPAVDHRYSKIRQQLSACATLFFNCDVVNPNMFHCIALSSFFL
jgi:hypothetical protein